MMMGREGMQDLRRQDDRLHRIVHRSQIALQKAHGQHNAVLIMSFPFHDHPQIVEDRRQHHDDLRVLRR